MYQRCTLRDRCACVALRSHCVRTGSMGGSRVPCCHASACTVWWCVRALPFARCEFELVSEPSKPLKAAARFVVPELCNVKALSVLVLVGQLLVLVLLFAGGELSWKRLALMSLFVQWVSLTSAGLLCGMRLQLARMGLVAGALVAFVVIMLVTLTVGLVSDRILVGGIRGVPVAWPVIGAQLLIAGIIAGMALRYFYVQQRLREQEQSELQSRIQALQSRIRPHFLFNSMNIIASLIGSDPETAEEVVEDLSELFRASLNDAGNQVPLTEELALCERYVRIEQLRLGERLRVAWQLEELPPAVKIPLLTIQPLLENAIYHGIQPIPEGGTITIAIRLDGGLVQIRIVNPLPEPTQRNVRKEGNRMAIANITSRLNALYGPAALLKAEARDDAFVAEVTYPFEQAAV